MEPSPPSSAPRSAEAVLDEVVNALRRGDADRAGRALAAAPQPPPAEAMLRLAGLNMRRRRWPDAAWLFDHAGGGALDAAARLKRCLSKNLACLQQHRPALYDLLVNVPASDACSIGTSATGRPTVVCRRGDGSTLSLSPGNDPPAGAAAAMRSLRPYLDKGQAFALCGAGDGYLLHALAGDETPLLLGMLQPVFVLEPDPQVVLHGLMIHDYTGPRGPIEQGRFFWFVGPEWAGELEAAVWAEPYLGCPVVAVPLGPDGQAMRARLQEIAVTVSRDDDATAGRIAAHYAATDPRAAAGLFGPNPPRPPRVLLLTTRFSSVLQYSTADAAEGFRRIGWDARVVIEPTPAHRIYRPAIRRALDEFRPDLVFQIDHLRHEHGPVFPAGLPFACWVQDHLPNLTSEAAGAAVGPTDFVLAGMPTMYVNRYGYPRRQCLALTKLTRIPPRPQAWLADGEDLVYVSSASQPPRDAAWDLLAPYANSPGAYDLVAECCRRMIELYEAGGSLPTHHAVRLFVEGVERELGFAVEKPGDRRELIDALFDRLGNLLYRQQSLAWAADLSRRHGLRLGIYGPGWDRNPAFAEFARGPVAYGPDLEALTRRSRVNLVLEPFFCTSHQRLLDGLAAGGFFLVRHHPTNTLMHDLGRFVACHAPASASTTKEVRAALDPADAPVFDELISRCGCLAEFGDPVEFVRDARRAGVLDDGGQALPFLRDVSFAGAAEMEQRVLAFVRDDARRTAVSRAQRENVEHRLSYAAGLARVIAAIGERLSTGQSRPSRPPDAAATPRREAA